MVFGNRFAMAIAALALVASPCMMAGCGNSGNGAADTQQQANVTGQSASENASEGTGDRNFAVLGDVFSSGYDSVSSGVSGNKYQYIFRDGDTWVCVSAKLDDGLADEVNSLWVKDPDAVRKLLQDVDVTSVEEYSALSQSELDAYIGKKGSDLIADSFAISSGYMMVSDESSSVLAERDGISYTVQFAGKLADDAEDNLEAAVADLEIEAMNPYGISDSVF